MRESINDVGPENFNDPLRDLLLDCKVISYWAINRFSPQIASPYGIHEMSSDAKCTLLFANCTLDHNSSRFACIRFCRTLYNQARYVPQQANDFLGNPPAK